MAAVSREEAGELWPGPAESGIWADRRAGGAPLTTQPGAACVCSYWSSTLKVPGQGFAVYMLIYHGAFLALQMKRHIANLATGLSAVDR